MIIIKSQIRELNYQANKLIIILILVLCFNSLRGKTNSINDNHQTILSSNLDTIPPYCVYQPFCGYFCISGAVWDLPDDRNIRSNLAEVYMDSSNSNNYDFSSSKIVKGSTVHASWNLTVTDINNDAKAVIYFVDNNGNDTSLIFNYYPYSLTLIPSHIDYGNITKGDSIFQDIWMRNDAKKDLYINYINLEGHGGLYMDILDNPMPLWLKMKDSIKLKIKFTAFWESDIRDTIAIGDSCWWVYRTEIQGKIVIPVINVSDIDFGDILNGKSVIKSMAITNTGLGNLIISWYSGLNDTVFHSSSLEKFETQFPFKLLPGISKIFEFTFTPIDDDATYLDWLTFTSNSENGDSICKIWARCFKPDINKTEENINFDKMINIYPNPAEETCTIFNNIPGNQKVKIYLINSLGEVVKTITDGFIPSNQAEIRLDVKELPIGIYNIILDYQNGRKAIKLTILR